MTAVRSGSRLLAGVLLLVTVPLAGWVVRRNYAADERRAAIAATVPQAARPGYATSDRCEACHPSQYHSWHRGYHRTMTQYASPETVRGDFADVRLRGGGYDVHLSRRGDDFMVDMVDPLWQYEVDFGQRPPPPPGQAPPRVERRVSMLTGSHHMQAYWVPSLAGNGQLSLPFTYLFDDHRWVPRSDVFLQPPGGRQQEQVWNVGCITCHSTAGQPRALVGGKQIATRVAELGIACEACHGPAEAHIEANQNPLHRYASHVKRAGDPDIVNPARLDPARASEVCGQCHSLTELSDDTYLGEGKAYVAGAELEKTQPLLRALQPTAALARHVREEPNYLRGYFWADGTIRVSSRDYSGMIESKCMRSGKLWCGSCHSLHQSDPVNLLAAGKAGDAACVQCHAAEGAAGAAHTHHKEGSSGARCYSCHMPYTVYGLLRAIRNHRIDSPRITGRSGSNERPNACNLCHLDRSLAWSAAQLAKWYKQPAVPLVDETPAAVAWLLSGDAVLRAVAAWHFGFAGARSATPTPMLVPYLLAALDDPYAAVRYVVGRAVTELVPGARFDYLAAPEQRRGEVEAIAGRWVEQLGGQRPDPASVAAIDARIRHLIEQRDNTPISAKE